MTETESSGVRFGRTVVDAVVGELIDQQVEAIIYPANSRGVMGAGPASSVRLVGGPEIERELMACAPIDLGEAVITASGKLSERGVQAIVHAVIAPTLGEAPRPSAIARAIEASLAAASAGRFRELAMPPLGLGAEAPEAERVDAVRALVEAIVRYLRRPDARLNRIVIVTRFDDDRDAVQAALTEARLRLWTSPA
jgi:O-acetyl-ADP-ribose deacetylase (regulator of RNase III)